jgi:hypothetical protein
LVYIVSSGQADVLNGRAIDHQIKVILWQVSLQNVSMQETDPRMAPRENVWEKVQRQNPIAMSGSLQTQVTSTTPEVECFSWPIRHICHYKGPLDVSISR